MKNIPSEERMMQDEKSANSDPLICCYGLAVSAA